MSDARPRSRPMPACPIRDGEPCSLCVPGVEGPQDCGLVWLVMHDPDLREQWQQRRRELRRGPAAAGSERSPARGPAGTRHHVA